MSVKAVASMQTLKITQTALTQAFKFFAFGFFSAVLSKYFVRCFREILFSIALNERNSLITDSLTFQVLRVLFR